MPRCNNYDTLSKVTSDLVISDFERSVLLWFVNFMCNVNSTFYK